jgi:hypothetical protein
MWARAALIGFVAVSMQSGFFRWDAEDTVAHEWLSVIAVTEARGALISKTVIVGNNAPKIGDAPDIPVTEKQSDPLSSFSSGCQYKCAVTKRAEGEIRREFRRPR